MSSGRQTGAFASVDEQSGIDAGEEGDALTAAGDPTLVGGVIASNMEASRSSFTTETLHASDAENSETWRARQVALGGGISGIGGIGADRAGRAGPGGATPLPGVPLGGLGRLSGEVRWRWAPRACSRG